MVIEKTSTIRNKAIFSDDGKYRYLLTRTWDEEKKKATIICLNPSKANELKTDRTVMNTTNFLVDNNYGSITIVNLFAFMATKPEDLKNREQKFENFNNEYIIKACNEADTIIVAWTSDKKDKVMRKREVENLLKPYKSKLKCFKDDKGKKFRHPRDLTDKWTLDEYEFSFI